MKVPAEFEDVFQGVELTEREIGFFDLAGRVGWIDARLRILNR